MKAFVKRRAKGLIGALVAVLGKTVAGRFLYGQILHDAMERVERVTHRGASLLFAVPNGQNQFRIDTFSTKEPETLEWIDGIPKGALLWDVGANVGLYTCYAAKVRNCRVFAFEPSVFNLELLARNIFLNSLAENVTIVPLPLSDNLAVNNLNMTTKEWGGALSTFGETYGFDGKPLSKVFEFSTIGLSMNDAAELLRIPLPSYIKMDVDGIEHLILKGGSAVLQNVQGVLIEINDTFEQQRHDAERYLSAAGLTLKDKRRWEKTDNTPFANTYNQIWSRDRRST